MHNVNSQSIRPTSLKMTDDWHKLMALQRTIKPAVQPKVMLPP